MIVYDITSPTLCERLNSLPSLATRYMRECYRGATAMEVGPQPRTWRARGGKWAEVLPAHRPRRDPTAAARVHMGFRVHPDTRKRLDREAKRTGESTGQVIDRLAAGL